ncbi:glycoside hydrolase family 2 TIM barrel-domain containing protein [Aeoliella sp. SH292]|uniref:glycoside hydrolase family 2 TIM barrel-domain containing protein n=1 Tax=Aeoliella sp. SH292 TaxID=3454464 RepID=UPI003F97904D
MPARLLCFTLLLIAFSPCLAESPIPVQVERSTAGAKLTRGGEPYALHGAGGQTELDLLKSLGGNSIRTWGADNLGPLLDQAHARGMTVCVGMWLGHERSGFDYSNEAAVVAQLEVCLEVVQKYKSHPAVLLWGIGNEIEGEGTNPAVWYAVEHIAREIKRIDPGHPTMTVIAELGDHKVESLHRFCPSIDIVGINSYGGIATVAERYRKAGGTKPYIVTEFGARGPWESEKTEWGAPIEPTSTAKAEHYAEGYRRAVAGDSLCLGSYAFLWGHKQETTATWFGMLLPDGSRLAAADTMSEFWTGKPVANRCPEIVSLDMPGAGKVKPGAKLIATAVVEDPEQDPLKFDWILRSDRVVVANGNDAQSAESELANTVVANGESAEVTMPSGGGGYRLFLYVRDGQGGAAVANVPLYVDAPIEKVAATKPKLPLVVYSDDMTFEPYAASGYMGNHGAIKQQLDCEENPHAGATCLRAEYTAGDQWGGVVWQSPPSDWQGEQPGGYDLSAASALEFWARGAKGGERVTFLCGLNTTDGAYHDSGKTELANFELTTEWQLYRIPLESLDRTRLKNGFGWTTAGQGGEVVFYLDDVRFVE